MRLGSEQRLPRKRRNLKRNRIASEAEPTLPYLVREFLEVNQRPYAPTPIRFVAGLSDPSVAADLAFNNFVSVTVPAPTSERGVLEEIANAQRNESTCKKSTQSLMTNT